MQVRAFAKINLTLEVLGRRDDGYHQIVTILQTVDLWDTLWLELAPRLELGCSLPELEGPENLVWKAASRLREMIGHRHGARMVLEKQIPAAMGLGGGSSDAAAALMGLDRLWGLGLGRDKLLSIAADLGSDVPFFMHGGTALAEGRGEVITPLPVVSRRWVLLLCPSCTLPAKTARLYQMLGSDDYSDGSLTGRLVQCLEGDQFASDLLYNAFERVAPQAFDGFDRARGAFLEAGASIVHLCGSGPGLFSLFSSQDDGERVLKLLKDVGWKAYLVNTISVEEQRLTCQG